MPEFDYWLVWSYEHGGWWRPGRLGYTPIAAEAGLFTREEAKGIERLANWIRADGDPSTVVHEQAVPLEGAVEPIRTGVPDLDRRIAEQLEQAVRDRDALVAAVRRIRAVANGQGTPVARCSRCGCSDLRACPGGCSWVEVDYEKGEGLCTACVPI